MITLDRHFRSSNYGIELADFLDGVIRDISVSALGEWGTDGDDVVNGSYEDQRLFGFAGNDELNGFGGNDRLDGGRGDDDHCGGAVSDLLIGNIGADNFDGGDGYDTLDLTYYGGDAIIDLSTELASFANGNTEDVINVEAVILGDGGDTVIGSNAANTLNDGRGDDVLTGGAGSDRYIFSNGFGHGSVTDFDGADVGEVIDLSEPAEVTSMSDILFQADENGGTVLRFDRNRDGIPDADASITLEGLTLTSADADHFIL